MVTEGEAAYNLPHLVKHSPTGFEYGYGGSGPSDLARSIIGDFLHDRNPDPEVYHHFKWDFVSLWREDAEHEITDDMIDKWMTEKGYYPAHDKEEE